MATQRIDDDTISVKLGDLGARANARVQSGDYASVSEVLQEGLRALDREDAMMEGLLRKSIAEIGGDDPADDMPAEEAFAEMRAYIAEARTKSVV